MLLPIVHMHLGRLRSFWADFGHVQLAQELSFGSVAKTDIKQLCHQSLVGKPFIS